MDEAPEVISVWPCNHGDVLVEGGRVPRNYQCATCGATATVYRREKLSDIALDVMADDKAHA